MQKRVFVRLLDINTGTIQASNNCSILAYIGSVNRSFPHECRFKNDRVNYQNNIWLLQKKDLEDNAFQIVLYKQRFLKGNLELGKFEFNIDALPVNKVVQSKFTLDTPYPRPVHPTILVEIHVTDIPNVIPFSAPRGSFTSNIRAYPKRGRNTRTSIYLPF